ncbi:MAG: hypothetical protein LC687_01375 [Actinobacteria bacterium]|nr:hypothetical protein [Actinomycetota bacterium]
MVITVVQNILTNPDEVNAAHSWEVAKYKPQVVATTIVEPMDIFEALELAYFKTQHIDNTWFEDAFWEYTQESRSSMVGDWIVVDAETYKVAGMGFEKVEAA